MLRGHCGVELLSGFSLGANLVGVSRLSLSVRVSVCMCARVHVSFAWLIGEMFLGAHALMHLFFSCEGRGGGRLVVAYRGTFALGCFLGLGHYYNNRRLVKYHPKWLGHQLLEIQAGYSGSFGCTVRAHTCHGVFTHGLCQ